MTWPALHITRSVDADVASVVAVAGDPARLPEWAAGVSSGIRLEGGRWLSDSPMGAIEIAFTGPRELGILDHDVTLPDGTVVRNPLRVLPNDGGSEVVFTLFRRPGATDVDLAEDAALVAEDLDRLAALVARG
ncbi:SRPBCC family protein [Clavibacter michiganensis]|uniref:SRPBCC family protein n=1 Tax=Clavibacter michiganensis TaxID=28447 RepID=UPI001D0A37D0|nr:SRPBCC family protein [Clavibacter michiganensis]UDM20770.1 SRPBCC family protein [Clavibacter michiganensis subsp. michiganensis]